LAELRQEFNKLRLSIAESHFTPEGVESGFRRVTYKHSTTNVVCVYGGSNEQIY